MKIWLLYSTFPERDKAFSAARALLDERLVACANVSAEMTSLYRWEGTLQQEPEVSFIAKTGKDKVEAAVARLKELHPYALPAILAWPVEKGFVPFLEWVTAETR